MRKLAGKRAVSARESGGGAFHFRPCFLPLPGLAGGFLPEYQAIGRGELRLDLAIAIVDANEDFLE